MAGTYRWKPEKPDTEDGLGAASGRCVDCAFPVTSVLRGTAASGQVVDHCPRCGLLADPFFEHDAVHTAISVILLKTPAWRHVIFNSGFLSLQRLAIVALCALVVECVFVGVLGPLHDASLRYATSVEPGSSVLLQTLSMFRLVYLVNNHVLLSKPAIGVIARLLVCGAAEAALTLLVFAWLASALLPGPVNGTSAGRKDANAKPNAASSTGGDKAMAQVVAPPPDRAQLLRAFLLMRTVRAAISVAVVWEAPVFLFVLLDVLGAVWYVVALSVVSGGRPFVAALGTIFGYGITAAVFRSATGWAPVYLWLGAVA